MKQFSELLPIAVFAGVYFYTKDIFLSTAVLMGAMVFQLAFEFATTKKVSRQTLFIFASVVILGGLTLVFRDEIFIQWKPTLVNWAFSLTLLVAMLGFKVNLLKKLLGQQLPLPDDVWANLAFGWSVAFFIAGALNLVVAFNFSMDFWVSYKLVGGFALTLFYMFLTMIYLVKGGHLEENNDADSATADDSAKPQDSNPS